MNNLKQLIASIVILFWFLLGMYTGASGLIYEEHERKELEIEQLEKAREKEGIVERKVKTESGISFQNKERAELYNEELNTMTFFGWIVNAPSFLVLVISSCGLGAFGGVIHLIRIISAKKVAPYDTQFIVIPFLGFMIGLVVLAISYLLPAILITDNDIQIRQTTLMCFSLFAGLFSNTFFSWLETRFGSFLKTKNDGN